jgi:hypothetical protein
MLFLHRYLAITLLSLTLNLIMGPVAHAHLMVAQHGTLNIVDDGVFMVLSLPISAFDGIDDDKDGNLVAGASIGTDDAPAIRVPIIVEGNIVGELRSEPRRRISSPLETAFSRQQLKTSWVLGISSAACSNSRQWLQKTN